MSKRIWDLIFCDQIDTTSYGPATFIGFLGDGLECKIATKYGNQVIPVSEIIMPGIDIPAQNPENAVVHSN